MFNWSEFGHAWLKLNWMLRLHSGIVNIALDSSWIWLHLVSLYLVFNLDSLHHPCLSNLAGVSHGLATSSSALVGFTVGFTLRFFLVQMPGGVLKTGHWCHDCDCHFLWLSLSSVTVTLCDCHLWPLEQQDRWTVSGVRPLNLRGVKD